MKIKYLNISSAIFFTVYTQSYQSWNNTYQRKSLCFLCVQQSWVLLEYSNHWSCIYYPLKDKCIHSSASLHVSLTYHSTSFQVTSSWWAHRWCLQVFCALSTWRLFQKVLLDNAPYTVEKQFLPEKNKSSMADVRTKWKMLSVIKHGFYIYEMLVPLHIRWP